MRSEALTRALCSGGDPAHPAIRSMVDFQAWLRAGCFVDPRSDAPRLRWHTVAQFLEWAHAKGYGAREIDRILDAIGTVRGRVGGGEQDQGALNSQAFNTTGAGSTLTVPDNVGFMLGRGFGAGGGGGGGGSAGVATSTGGGAGGGSIASVQSFAVTPGQTLTGIAGTGGTSGAATANGGPGGDTTVTGPGNNPEMLFPGASGGGGGLGAASDIALGGQNITFNGVNLYAVAVSGGATNPANGSLAGGGPIPLNLPAAGGSAVSSLTGIQGGTNPNSNGSARVGGVGGTNSTLEGGGGGGGAGPGANGGAGGNGVAGTGGVGASPAANTGAGGGGGGGGTPGGAGGVGGSGHADLFW